MNDHFRVRFTAEFESGVNQPGPKGFVVFNDPVMHQRDVSMHRDMGMGVFVARLPVGGPAGMAYSGGPGERQICYRFFK
ncbi:hypothetical protein SDC9_200766 [bioreactor metagenome]|uniref:Uncharacterized protein n=1 Tax=bioreactor metagenome TaxID=1076179 RepID=A0A645IQE2_9ZZZZ